MHGDLDQKERDTIVSYKFIYFFEILYLVKDYTCKDICIYKCIAIFQIYNYKLFYNILLNE